ncbi:MAG: polyprenyl synthetase family protein [Bacteroidaceae bacterium]|nr:polyprenyl synthetase family protein [Bacteroidaceae bacterium]
MYSWEQAREKVNKFIAGLDIEKEPKELYRPITYILSQSGKRVRPVLLLMAYNMYRDDIDAALYPAVAMETYHNYTLIHDDVMDRADMRRGMPTVAAKWGDNAAILSGDTALVLAYEFMSHVADDKLRDMLALFTQTAKEIGEGQQYDMEFETRDEVSEQEYIEMIRLKTSVLLAACLKMGGILAGASEADLANLYAYGQTMGLAFQLQDDLLDVYGDTKIFGKKIGGDIVCNKKTFLLIKAMETATPEQLSDIKGRMAQDTFDREQKVEYFTNLYNELGIRKMCEDRINELFAQCDSYIEKIALPKEKKTALKEFADTLLNRNI